MIASWGPRVRFVGLGQGGPEWLAWRGGGLGSSDAAVVVSGRHFGTDVRTLWASKCGLCPGEKRSTWAMEQGKRLEPAARAWFEDVVGCRATPACCEHGGLPWLRASLDGWVAPDLAAESMASVGGWDVLTDYLSEAAGNSPGRNGCVVEIKYASRDRHSQALNGIIPPEYLPQLNHQLLAVGGNLAYYVSLNPRFSPPEKVCLVEYEADPATLEEQLRREGVFWSHVVSRTEPPAYID